MVQGVRIFVSSPGDVPDERLRAALVISRLKREFARFFDLSKVLWEYEPMLASGHFQDVIEPPSSADIFVLILWSRLGTPLPERTATREYRGLDDARAPVTGTEWEFEDALRGYRERKAPDLLVYRKTARGFAEFSSPEDLEAAAIQKRALDVFWDRYFGNPATTFKAGFNLFSGLDEFEAKLEAHLRERLRARLPPGPLRSTRRAGDAVEWWSGSPYRGLQAFDFDQAAVFFGRERAEREISEALVRNAAQGAAFILVLGASGSGKSSLARAGLLPDLTASGTVEGVSTWRRLVVTPADLAPDPFAGLTTALLGATALPELLEVGFKESEIVAHLRAGDALAAAPLRMALERAAARDVNGLPAAMRKAQLVLVLDQMETLFTLASFSNETRAAVDALLANLARGGLVWVVATLRSDFFHRLGELPRLSALANGAGQYHLAAPSDAELELMIARPAEVAGISFEVDEKDGVSLAAAIRQAASRDPASLPLLSFVLDELYRRDAEGGGDVLTYASYRELGGLEGAIARHADRFVAGLPEDLAAALPALLLSLVEVDELRAVATARMVRLATIADSRQRQLAERIVGERLAVADGVADSATIKLAHEALLVHWPRLAALIEQHREFLVMRRRMQAEAANWERHGRHDDFLLPSGLRLAEAADLLSRNANLEPEIVAFATASIEAAKAREAAAQSAKEAALRAELKRSRRVAAIVSLLFALALAGGGVAWNERTVATDALAKAEASYLGAIHQAVDDFQLLEDNFNSGNLKPEIIEAMVEKSRATIDALPSSADTVEVTAARAQLLDVFGLMQLNVNDAKALDSARQENALVDQLLAKDADSPRWLRLKAIARGQLSDVSQWQCDDADAIAEAQISLKTGRPLLVATPSDDFLHDRLVNDDATIGDASRALGDVAAAQSAYADMLGDIDATVKAHAGDARWLADLAYAQERVGDIALLTDKPEEAASHYQIQLATASQLAADHPTEANYREALAKAHEKLGDANLASGALDAALAQYQDYLAEVMALGKDDPSKFRYQAFVAVANQRIGELFLAQKKIPEATAAFETYRQLSAAARDRDPANGIALYDVANALGELGDAELAGGDAAAALASDQQSLALAKALVAKPCQNGTWRKALAMAYRRIGMALEAEGQPKDAAAQYAQCAAVDVKPLVWAEESVLPRDAVQSCRDALKRLGAASGP
jgi:hypothetical protein